MADFGLLAGLAEGLDRGVKNFSDQVRYGEERAERKKRDALADALTKVKLRESGVDYDEASGDLIPIQGFKSKEEKDWERFKKQESFKANLKNRSDVRSGNIPGLTPGEKAADTDFGKNLLDWTTSGLSTKDKNIKRLQDAKEALKSGPKGLLARIVGQSGPLNASLPDLIKPEENIVTRDDVRAAAQGALKATLGAQFTEKEGERIMNMAYNERLSPEENIKKIDAAIKEISDIANERNAQTEFFRNRGTLKGYTPKKGLLEASAVETKTINGSTYEKVNGGWKKVK